MRGDGQIVRDIRPLVRMNVSVVVGDGDRQESGSFGAGGRKGFGEFLAEESWRHAASEALRQALVNLRAVPAPAGTFDIVLSSGWPGVMLHEAVGHGLEGDFNRKKTSAFAGLMGSQVAAKGVTVVDDGTMTERRGSLTIDDEGTPTNRTVLIEDGKLVGYMQDRQNARLMGMKATGNGRRESYAHQPMPRMTNTYMTSGDMDPEEIIASVKNGVYAVSFGGGQVDITSGKFVFGCTEAYMIEDGKVTQPIKGAMLIGNGPDAMHRVSMIGNDMKLDNGIGMCGKAGQGVPVGVGQPHLRMDQMTLGGTRVEATRGASSERDLHRRRAALRCAVEHGLDVVAVGVQQKGGVVAGVVIGPLARLAVVDAAALETGRVESVDHGAIPCLEGEMMASRQLSGRRLAVGGRDEKLVGPEKILFVAGDRYLQYGKDGLVEASAGFDIPDNKLDVVDQPTAVQFLGFHAALLVTTP